MVASLDGFVAKKDGDISWMQSLDHYEKGMVLTEAYIADFLKSIDCYVMGARTYEHALELGWPYGDTPVVVLTNRDLKSERESVSFYSGDLHQLLEGHLQAHYRSVWMVGGPMLTKAFLQAGLADEIVMSIMPVILGDGLLFFDYIGRQQRLHLKNVNTYQDGMVELSYEIVKM